MEIENLANLIEAGLWFGVALVWVSKSVRATRPLRFVFVLLAIAFLVFGITDLIESQTGAWWRPLWLLGMKVACVVSFVLGFAAYYRIARSSRSGAIEPDSDSFNQ